LTYSKGDKCPSDSSKTFDLEIKIKCDKTGDKMVGTAVDETDPCKPVISFSSNQSCPVFSTTAWISFLGQHPYILGALLLVFGGIVTFFGRKFFQYTIATIGFGVGFLTTMLLFSVMGMLDGFNESKESIFLTIASFIIALIVATFLAFIMFKTIKFGAMLLGAISGGLIGVTLYNLIFFSTDSFYLLVVTCILLGLGGAFLAYKYFDAIVILSTALIGAYSLTRGASLYLGRFPDEVELLQKLANGIQVDIPYQFYLYLTVMLVLFFLGTAFQFREKKRAQQENFTLQK